jgi:hypothetical protein
MMRERVTQSGMKVINPPLHPSQEGIFEAMKSRPSYGLPDIKSICERMLFRINAIKSYQRG